MHTRSHKSLLASPPSEATDQLAAGQQQLAVAGALFAAGRHAEAETAFQAVQQNWPGQLQCHLQLGHCARQLNRHADAFAHFQAAATAAPGDQWPVLEMAESARALLRWDQAAGLYQSVLVLARDNARAWLGLGYCARQRGEHATAFALFQAGALAAPNDPWPRLEASAELRALGQPAAAEAGFAEVLAMTPDNVQAHLGLGHCVRARAGPAASLPHFQAAAAAAPGDPWPLIEAAADWRELNDTAAAEAALNNALALAPGNVQALLGLGHCARRRGDHTQSLSQFQAAMRADPADPWPALEAAADLRELDRLDAAEAICQAVLATRPGQAEGLLGLGLCARARGDSAEALARFQAAAAAAPNSIGARLEIATEQRNSGDDAAATATAQDILQHHPNNLHAMLSLGETERFCGRHEAAFAAFEAAATAHPAHAGARVEMALAARSLGQPAQCAALLTAALALEPQNAAAITRLGEQALIAGDAERAQAIFEQALAEQPGQIEFRFGLVESRAARGEIMRALADLSAMESGGTHLPRIKAKRLNLLRRAGDNLHALGLARQATNTHPHFFELWVERFQLELLLGDDQALQACLDAMPAASVVDAAFKRRFAGNAAERGWRLAEAISAYEAAAALQPHDAGIQHDLVRAKLLVLETAQSRRHLRRFCALTAHVTRLQRKSLNLSQTHYGQIIDDYCLDAALLETLRRMQALPAAERAVALAAALRDNPDSTAAAVSLLVAMRQSGALAKASSSAVEQIIPAVVTQFWDAAVPDDVAAIMQSWPALNAGYRFQLFNDATATAFLRQHYPPDVLQAYRRVREPAQKADIFRLAYLVVEGGVYVDADDRCLAPLPGLLPAGATLVFYQEDHGTLGNNFIAAAPGNAVLAAALRLGVAAVNRGDIDNVWLATGPALLTRSLAHALAMAAEPSPQLPDGWFVLHRCALFQAVAVHCAADYKRSERHWSNSAFARRRQPVGTALQAG